MDNQRICKYCGNPVRETANYCGQCGHAVANIAEESVSSVTESTMEVTDIVMGIRNGDNRAFNDFYAITNKKAYSVAYQMLKKEDEAFDMLQDAYVKAYNKIDTVDNPESLISWFNMIVANTCRDYLKKNKPVLFNELDTEDFEFEDTLENQNEEFVPEAMTDYNETKRLMTDILDNLSPEQKLCTLLYYYDELSVKEIAAALECSENTVKSRLNYARKKIKADVLDLEKKGTKLYGIAPIPFIVWMLKGAESTYTATDALYAKIAAELWTGTGAAVTAETAAVASASEAATSAGVSGAGSVAGTKAAIGIAGKSAAAAATAVAGKSIATKVIAGIVAVSLAVGGGVGGKVAYDNYQEKQQIKRHAEQEATVIEALDTEFMKGILLFATQKEVDERYSDDEIYQILRYIMRYKYYEVGGLNIINEETPNPLRDEEVEVREDESGIGRRPAIACDVQALNRIAKVYGYEGDVQELIEKHIKNLGEQYILDIWIENDKIIYMPSPRGEYYNSAVTYKDVEVQQDKVTLMVTLDIFYHADYLHNEIETSQRNIIVTLESDVDGYVIRRVVEVADSTVD